MSTRLDVTATWNGKMAFTGKGHLPLALPIDYIPPLGDDQGLMPLELLLISLAACSGASVALLLGRAEQEIKSLDVHASAERRTEHPTVFTNIHLEFQIKGSKVDSTVVDKCIRASEERFCPVWAMLKPSVPITTTFAVDNTAD
jgi:putative redox protein